jgi:uncharacterized protein (DUF2141 family)
MTSIKTPSPKILALCLAVTLPLVGACAQTGASAPTPQAVAPTSSAGTASLVLAFPELKQKTGVLMIAVYDGLDGWKSGKSVRAVVAAAAAAEPAVKIDGLAPGTYAVRVFQDLDGDGKLGTNPFGLPNEPYGFSNGAKANMGPPSFADASFVVAPGANRQTLSLK